MLRFSTWVDKLGSSSSGQTTVLMAAGAVILAAFIGMAADIGGLRNIRQHMQSAADSAAIAAVQGMQTSQSAAKSNAIADAGANGFEDGKNGVSVAVEPVGSEYEQVVISQPEPTYFMKVLGVDSIPVSVTAQAHLGNSPYCVYVLDPTDSGTLGGTLSAGGGASLVAKCGIIVDSDSSTAVNVSGGLTLVQATVIGIVGDYSIAGGAVLSPTPKTHIVPADDPLKNLVEPAPGTCTPLPNSANNTNNTITTDTTLAPGTYCGNGNQPAIKVTGGANLTFSPGGTFIIDGGGISLTGNGNITGTGVTIYNTFDSSHDYGPITITGGGTVTLSAPTSGTYEGILFMADRNIDPTETGSDIEGGASSVYNGVLYFPSTSLTFMGNTSTTGSYTTLVADRLTLKGSSQLNDNYSQLTDGSPIKGATLTQ